MAFKYLLQLPPTTAFTGARDPFVPCWIPDSLTTQPPLYVIFKFQLKYFIYRDICCLQLWKSCKSFPNIAETFGVEHSPQVHFKSWQMGGIVDFFLYLFIFFLVVVFSNDPHWKYCHVTPCFSEMDRLAKKAVLLSHALVHWEENLLEERAILKIFWIKLTSAGFSGGFSLVFTGVLCQNLKHKIFWQVKVKVTRQ